MSVASLMIRRSLLIAFAGLVAGCASSPSLPPPPAEPPVFDRLIVPGKRVGPISLGMTRDQVIAALGLPVETFLYGGGTTGLAYQRINNADRSFSTGLEVIVGNQSSRVENITVGTGAQYATTQGLAVGMQESKVRELMGAPDKIALRTKHTYDTYCYPGLRVYFIQGAVILLSVRSPDCSNL